MLTPPRRPGEVSPNLLHFIGLFVPSFTMTFGLVACVRIATATGGPVVSAPLAQHESPVPQLDTGEAYVREDLTVHCEGAFPEGLNDMIHDVAERTGVNPRALALTVYRESRCDATALGAAGEIGLGQVHPRWWRAALKAEGIIETDEDLWDPETNLEAVAYVLWALDDQAKGDVHDALRRYNGSGAAAERYARQQVARHDALWGEPLTWLVHEGC